MPRSKRKRLMSPEPGAPDAARRRLLTGGALTVAASAAAVARPLAGPEAEAAAPEAQDKAKLDYRVTDYIAAYYARARG